MLPGLTDRVHRGLYGVLLGACMESYQGLLTDLSDVCRRCYWVLLGVTVGSYQRLLTNLSDGLCGVLPDFTD